MAKVISICNQKGGVGKTTTAINLATYLALAGKRILLIDLDPQGNATSGLGIDKSNINASTYNLLLDQLPPENVVIPTQVDNLFLIPSNVNLTGAEIELVGVWGREYKLKKAISGIKDSYDSVLIDCPPSLGLLTINGLAASDSTIIPIQCEYYALEGLGQLVNTVNLVRENLNQELKIEGILLTMADYRTNLTGEVIAEVRKYFADMANAGGATHRVYDTVIPRNIRLTEAPGFGKPIAFYDNNSAGALKYLEFANEIMGIKSAKNDKGTQNTNVNGEQS